MQPIKFIFTFVAAILLLSPANAGSLRPIEYNRPGASGTEYALGLMFFIDNEAEMAEHLAQAKTRVLEWAQSRGKEARMIRVQLQANAGLHSAFERALRDVFSTSEMTAVTDQVVVNVEFITRSMMPTKQFSLGQAK